MLAELNQYTGDEGKQTIKIRSTHPARNNRMLTAKSKISTYIWK
jgi:hypothetical protein